jgi:ergothioneine biosynthesis protein EgtB
MAAQAESVNRDSVNSLSARFARTRELSVNLVATLAPEDTVVQSMPDVSPTKWHLAHTTWFFERFLLEPNVRGYERFNDKYDFLFNSYYYTAGQMHARPKRGLLSRPTLAEVLAYRSHVDDNMLRLLGEQATSAEIANVVVLGINHEQQHQELLLTDIKHVLSRNPLLPAFDASLPVPESRPVDSYSYVKGASGIHQAGAVGDGFHFDNETPRHDTLLHEHRIGTRLVTNGEYREFITDGAYEDPSLWLSDGWATVNQEHWSRPLYWSADLASEFTLGGLRDIDDAAPVTHVSFYEADAFARWAAARLPTEFEWETFAAGEPVEGNLSDAGFLHPIAGGGASQVFGDAWEWTSSPYSAYPGFVPLEGSLGEYNGKFMCSQMTARGGSCVTSKNHVRASYRNFFYPQQRWQFFGIRLAKDGHD